MKSSHILNESELPIWQADLINQMLNSMHDFYCLPDKFEENKNNLKNILITKCKEINETLLNGASDRPPHSKETYIAFVDKINEALHSFDTHLELAYNPLFIDEMKKANKIKLSNTNSSAKFDFSGGPPKEEVEKWNKYEEENPTFRNFGFVDYQGKSGVIPENIGYVNISHLIDPQLGADETEDKYRMGPNAIKRLHEVMGKLRDKEAIILDLSVTPYGGSPEMVQNIVSFFMPEHTPINTVQDRLSGNETLYEAISTPFKILDKPVALVVGANTFSGREEITYDLQQYNRTLQETRFTVIGQPTKGGAHPECSFPLIDKSSGKINDNLILHVPYARSINPISGTNWEDQEKKGVQPDILVKNEDALTVAVQHLNKTLTHESTNNLSSNAKISKILNVKQPQSSEQRKEEVTPVQNTQSKNMESAKQEHLASTRQSEQTINQETEVDKGSQRKITPFETNLRKK